ncbi:MAG TPA: hypothetical protein VFZ09_37575 [Archangium sp.]|uniref:hypothetical protein n=1 Tax=Archangium sp. TaxID=1872627 RepID=UPI002E339266|nr:hypothetical protein [Archangium sp.]HEX5751991.1 hypothetical protein [Archangium sp.]
MTNTISSKSIPSNKRPGFTTRALVSSLAGAMLALTGCGPESEADATQAERQVIEYSSEVLGEFETAGGARLSFTVEYEGGNGGTPVVSITEVAPLNAPSSLDRLNARGATSLEAFLAVAPEGTEVPAPLREVHVREAARRGRTPEVRELSANEVSMMETVDSTACDSYTAFTSNVSGWNSELLGNSIDNHQLIYRAGGDVVASMCNFDSNRVDYKYAQFCYEVPLQGSDLGLLYCDAKILVPDGHRVNKVWFSATADRLVRAEKLENYTLSVTSFIAIGGLPPVP